MKPATYNHVFALFLWCMLSMPLSSAETWATLSRTVTGCGQDHAHLTPSYEISSVDRAQKESTPSLVPESGRYEVKALAVSPDGHLIVSGYEDGTVRVWDVDSGHLLRTMFEHRAGIRAVRISSDGGSAVSCSEDGDVKLWQLSTGIALHTYSAGRPLIDVAISEDQANIVAISAPTLGHESEAILWNTETEKEVNRSSSRINFCHAGFSGKRPFAIEGPCPVSFVSGAMIAGRGLEKGTLQARDLLSGQQSTLDHVFTVGWGVGFSSEGQIITVCDFAKHTVLQWNLQDNTAKPYALPRLPAKEAKLSGMTNDGRGAVFSLRSSKQFVQVFKTGRVLEITGGVADGPSALASGGFKVVYAGNGGVIKVVSEDKNAAKCLEGQTATLRVLAGSVDGSQALIGSTDGFLHVWNLSIGKETRRFKAHDSEVVAARLSEDNRTVISVGRDGSIKQWDIGEGEHSASVGQLEDVTAAAINVKGSSLFSVNQSSLTGWDIKQKKSFVQEFAQQSTGHLRPREGFDGLVLSPDEQTIFVYGWTKIEADDMQRFPSLRLFNVKTNTWSDIGGSGELIRDAAFSPDSKTLMFIKGQSIHFMATDMLGQSTSPLPIQASIARFANDGKIIFVGASNGEIIGVDANNKTTLFRIPAHTSPVTSILQLNGRGLVLSSAQDGSLALWAAKEGGLIAHLFSLRRSGCAQGSFVGPEPAEPLWAVSDDSGHFDRSTIEDLAGFSWVFPDDPLRALLPEVFMRQYYEPRLLQRLLDPGSKFEVVPPLAALNRVQPEVKVSDISVDKNSRNAVTVVVDVASVSGAQMRDNARFTLSSGVFDLRLFRDGQLVGYKLGSIVDSSGRASIPFSVHLPRRAELKEIEFTAYAFNSDRVKSATAKRIYKPELSSHSAKGRAYVISLGVNAYQDENWDLDFAARDAEISDRILTEKLKALGTYEVVPLLLTSDYRNSGKGHVVTAKCATKKNFQTVLELLAHGPDKVAKELVEQIPGASELRKVNPEDLVLITFSSHGYTDLRGKFYLLPYDTGSEIEFTAEGQEITPTSLSHFISSDDLSEWVRDIDAGELVMIVDTCHSAGAVAEPGFKPGPMGSRGMGQLAYDKGMRMLAASQADDIALEVSNLQQGLLTYVLIREGLEQGKADRNGDTRITLDEWLAYGAQRVPTLYEDVKLRRVAALKRKDVHITSVLSGASINKNAFQQPQLFDFKRKRREVLVATAR